MLPQAVMGYEHFSDADPIHHAGTGKTLDLKMGYKLNYLLFISNPFYLNAFFIADTD